MLLLRLVHSHILLRCFLRNFRSLGRRRQSGLSGKSGKLVVERIRDRDVLAKEIPEGEAGGGELIHSLVLCALGVACVRVREKARVESDSQLGFLRFSAETWRRRCERVDEGMYRLLTGFYAHLRRKEEVRSSLSISLRPPSDSSPRCTQFSVLILGLDNAGKTTFLEKVKSTFNDTPFLDPTSIAPTIGQNIGRITLSSSVLQFWDLGGQREIRGLWEKYYLESSAVCFVIDSTAKERLEECWSVFGTFYVTVEEQRDSLFAT